MAPTELKQYSIADVASHNKPNDLWMIIHDKVYDVTKFLQEHPGGEEVLIEVAGKEASSEFDDVGHSTDAKESMKQYLVGEIIEAERKAKKSSGAPTASSTSSSSSSSSWLGSLKTKFFG
ncbi:cytochrome b5-like isoform X3 [Anopheles coustani]|uniref:cytochrome b5-like isoform X3 n=1 Tax=Anopheles coustani TaxID=139045 RepID=UPI0026584A40|nr:cytochrome b5-like isoform X3 [Anopheles coustani]